MSPVKEGLAFTNVPAAFRRPTSLHSSGNTDLVGTGLQSLRYQHLLQDRDTGHPVSVASRLQGDPFTKSARAKIEQGLVSFNAAKAKRRASAKAEKADQISGTPGSESSATLFTSTGTVDQRRKGLRRIRLLNRRNHKDASSATLNSNRKERKDDNKKPSKGRSLALKIAAGGAALAVLPALSGCYPETREGFVEQAQSEIGEPYVWGGNGPNGFDCSGLVQYSLEQIGMTNVPRTSEDQANWVIRIRRKQLRPGDVILEEFPTADKQEPPNHIVIYAGGGYVIEAAQTGIPVREVRWSRRILHEQGGYVVEYGRIPGLPAQ